MNDEVTVITPQNVAESNGRSLASASATPMELLDRALSSGADISLLEKLMALQERWEQNQARKAFYEAKAAFKAEAPDIIRDMENKQYKSTYASIGNVVNTTNKCLSKHGIDARWEVEQGEKQIKVTCVLTHNMGHSEQAFITAPPDSSGQKNPIQQIKSTLTYLRIATFEAVTGIATREGNEDDDGKSAETSTISDDQIIELGELAEAVGADREAFCKYLSQKTKLTIENFADIPASYFERAKSALNAKKAQK